MSTQKDAGNRYDGHRRAAELHDAAAHAHLVADQHGMQDHLTGHEQSRKALEHSQKAHLETHAASGMHGIVPFGHNEIALLAHDIWHSKGCPEGSDQEDWFQAVAQLRSRAYGH